MKRTKKAHPEMGKWSLWKYFYADAYFRPYLPPTKILNSNSFRSFISKYDSVYIKPQSGYGGKGIIKAWKNSEGFFFIKEKGKARKCASVNDLYKKIINCTSGKGRHIIQKTIELAKINGHPFDIRIMMMREKDNWEYMGMLAKVAGKNSVVCNFRLGGGYIIPVEKALQKSLGLSKEQTEQLCEEMIQLGFKTCRRFDRYKRYWRMGLDLAVDKNGRIWMLEENTGPAFFIFNKLEDKSAYRKIVKIAVKKMGKERVFRPKRPKDSKKVS